MRVSLAPFLAALDRKVGYVFLPKKKAHIFISHAAARSYIGFAQKSEEGKSELCTPRNFFRNGPTFTYCSQPELRLRAFTHQTMRITEIPL